MLEKRKVNDVGKVQTPKNELSLAKGRSSCFGLLKSRIEDMRRGQNCAEHELNEIQTLSEILESLVGEGRLRAVRFFGNLAAVGTLFILLDDRFLFDGYLIKIAPKPLKC